MLVYDAEMQQSGKPCIIALIETPQRAKHQRGSAEKITQFYFGQKTRTLPLTTFNRDKAKRMPYAQAFGRAKQLQAALQHLTICVFFA